MKNRSKTTQRSVTSTTSERHIDAMNKKLVTAGRALRRKALRKAAYCNEQKTISPHVKVETKLVAVAPLNSSESDDDERDYRVMSHDDKKQLIANISTVRIRTKEIV